MTNNERTELRSAIIAECVAAIERIPTSMSVFLNMREAQAATETKAKALLSIRSLEHSVPETSVKPQ